MDESKSKRLDNLEIIKELLYSKGFTFTNSHAGDESWYDFSTDLFTSRAVIHCRAFIDSGDFELKYFLKGGHTSWLDSGKAGSLLGLNNFDLLYRKFLKAALLLEEGLRD